MAQNWLVWLKSWEQWKKAVFFLFWIFALLYILKVDLSESFFLGKTVWEWIRFVLVPAAVPFVVLILGRSFQEQQQNQAADESREEALQSYLDRCTALLVEHDFLNSESHIVNTGVDIIRAQTLSILRRLQNDSERKSSVIRFLSETKVVSKKYLSLEDADLNSTQLCFLDLSNINLRNSNLSKADFTGTKLINASLQGANLSKSNFTGAKLTNSKFLTCEEKMRGANFSHASLKGCELNFCDFTNVNLSYADMSDASLSGVDFTKAKINGNPIFINAFLPGTIFRNMVLVEAIFRGANFYSADLLNANFHASYFDKANMAQAKLDGANFSKADLIEADFLSASLKKVNFVLSDLENARFHKANLSHALFIKTDLDGADFNESVFQETNFINSDLRKTKNLALNQLENCYLCGVAIPSNITNLSQNKDCDKLLENLIKNHGYSLKEAKKTIEEARNRHWD